MVKTTSKRRYIYRSISDVWAYRNMVLLSCLIGAAIGLVLLIGTPREYTASTRTAYESGRTRSVSVINALAGNANSGANSSIDRDAIYPSLYRYVIHSTPFLLKLPTIEVCMQGDSLSMPLGVYIKEHHKKPWWNAVTSAPKKLLGWGMSLFSRPSNAPEVKKRPAQTVPSQAPFRITRQENAIGRAIASRIKIEIDKEKRVVALSVTMQDPQVAAIVADTVQARLNEYITHYRTSKASRLLKYNEKLYAEAQAAYYKAQDSYAQYADANRNLVMLASRGELTNRRIEMQLALTACNQLERQVQAAKARLKRVVPIYTVIQPVTVPLTPSKPRKALILATCIVLSGLGSIGWILFGAQAVSIFRRIVRPSQISPNEKR